MRGVARILASTFLLAGILLLPAFPSEAGVSVQRDVEYGKAGGERLLLDVYRPGGGGLHPGVVAIHGGRWANGDKSDIPAEEFAELGHVVFAVNYRLAPEHVYPAAVEDVEKAVRWVRAHAGQYGVDPDRIWALGGSAGGHLAGMLATAAEGEARVAAAVSYSGPMDLERLAESSRGLERTVMDFLGCKDWNKKCRGRAREASPVTNVDQGDAPLYLANGTDEPIPLRQATRMANALERAGVAHRLRKIRGDDHAFQYRRAVLHPSTAFVAQHFGGPPPAEAGGAPAQGSGSGQGEPGGVPNTGGGGKPEEDRRERAASSPTPEETLDRASPRAAAAPRPAAGGGSPWVMALIIAFAVGGAVASALLFREPPEGQRPA
jgi:acetyl esterase/lipase